jgi:hypothetical protein
MASTHPSRTHADFRSGGLRLSQTAGQYGRAPRHAERQGHRTRRVCVAAQHNLVFVWCFKAFDDDVRPAKRE